MLFQPRQPPFLSVPNVVFIGSLLVALKGGCRIGDGQSYCGCSK